MWLSSQMHFFNSIKYLNIILYKLIKINKFAKKSNLAKCQCKEKAAKTTQVTIISNLAKGFCVYMICALKHLATFGI